jgi:hypothetical protein
MLSPRTKILNYFTNSFHETGSFGVIRADDTPEFHNKAFFYRQIDISLAVAQRLRVRHPLCPLCT